jgi:hypothetical protein
MTPAQIEAYVDATAALLELPLAAEHRPGVLHYFSFAASLARLIEAHPLDVTDDPAESFVPISPTPHGSLA